MTRHGASHGAATLVSTALAGVLVDPFREIMPRLSYVMDGIALAIVNAFNLPYPLGPDVVSILLLATFLAFLWGVIFAVANRASRRQVEVVAPPPRGGYYF